jgi:hypothetical protein
VWVRGLVLGPVAVRAYLRRHSTPDTPVLLLIMKPPRKKKAGGVGCHVPLPLGRADGATYPVRRRVPCTSTEVFVIIGHPFRDES